MANGTLSTALTGARIEKNFSYIETSASELDTEVIYDIITRGDHNGAIIYVIRDAFSPESAARIVRNFDRLLDETSGGNRLDDAYVKTSQIGATQVHRSGDEYVREVIRTLPMSLDLVDGVSHEELEQIFGTARLESLFAKKGIVFRGSRFKNIPAGFSTFRRWLNTGEMALMPHEDTAQLLTAKKDGYEIAGARHIVSFNAAIEAADEGGELMAWNLNPDDRCRENLGVVGVGYPYPIRDLEGVETLSVRLRQGDAYFLNSSFVHGVTSTLAGRRLSAGRFIGQIADDVVVYWT